MKRIVIKKKYIYMLFLLVICLLGFVIVPTFAKFTSNYTTDDDIVGLAFDFDVGISSIEEYEEVNVSSGKAMKFNVEITNSSSSTAYYGVWYKAISPEELSNDITIARLEGTDTTTSGSIDNGASKTVTVIVINNSSDDLKINIGVASSTTSTEDIEYLGGRKLISGTAEDPFTNEPLFPVLASTYIQNLYNDGSSINTVNIGGDTANPQVSLNATQGIMLDNNGNYRYYGANPNNYVSYNNELWRIISVGNVKSSESDTTGETRVKIVKADILTAKETGTSTDIIAFSYDSSASTVNSGYGVNDWSKADLMTELNTLYYNSTSGTCYTGGSNASKLCDFTNTGLSAEARNLTADALYYLGGSSEYEGLYADDYYTFERGTEVYGCGTDDGACPRATIWTGRIGIIYPSDYSYATDLSVCTSDVYYYDNDGCYDNDWLLYASNYQWIIAPHSSYASHAFGVFGAGGVYGDGVIYAGAVRPVQYLRSNVAIVGGEGTSGKPYQLSLS